EFGTRRWFVLGLSRGGQPDRGRSPAQERARHEQRRSLQRRSSLHGGVSTRGAGVWFVRAFSHNGRPDSTRSPWTTTASSALRSASIARWPFTRRNLASARSSPATHERRRMSPSRHRVTPAVTRGVTLRPDSIGLVVARARRNALGTPSRTTVSVSSRPSRRLDAAAEIGPVPSHPNTGQ